MAAPTNAAKREESPCQPGAVHTWHKCEVQRCPLFGRHEGKSGRRGHRVFVDTEVIRGGPLLEVAGHGREAWRAAPRYRAVAVSSTSSPRRNPRAVLLRQKSICDNQSHHAREN